MNTRLIFFVLAMLAGPFPARSAPFTYQGVLTESGRPAESNYDLRFRIYGGETGGVLLAVPVFADNLAMRAGHFVVLLDFGDGIFNGQERWLEIAVRPAGSPGDYTTLVPRQLITAAPYAITAQNLLNASPAIINDASSNFISGTIRSPLRVQDETSSVGEIRVVPGEIVFSGDDASADHQGTTLLLQAGNAMGPDKNGGNIILVPGFGTGAGRSGRVVVDGALKITGPLAATALFADGSGIVNLSASNLTGVIGNQQLAGLYANPLQLINPANQFHGIFSGDGAGLSNLVASVFTGVVPSGGLSGTYANALEFSNSSNQFNGTFAGDGRGLSNVTASALKGVLPNAGLSGTYSQVLNLSNASNTVLGIFSGDGSGLANLQAAQVTGVLSSEHLAGAYSNALRLTNSSNEIAGVFQGDGTALSLSASRLSGTLPAGALSGTYDRALNLANPGNSINGVFAGNGAGVSNVNAATLGGLGGVDFAQRRSSNFFSAAQTFAGPVLFSNTVSAEGDLHVRGGLNAATLTGNGAGLANLNASTLNGSIPGGALSGTYGNVLSLPNSANSFQGSFAGDGSRLANVAASNLTGVLASARLQGAYSNALQFSNAANQFHGAFSGNGAALTALNAGALTGLLPGIIVAGTYPNALDFPNPGNTFRGSFVGDGFGLANVPFANLAGVLRDAQLQGAYTNPLQLNNSSNEFTGKFSGDGSALNNLNASALVSGTVPDARLGVNVAKLNSSAVFTGSVTAQDDLLASRLSVGTIGINTTNPVGRALLVNGAVGITSSNTLEFGANVAGKHINAGKIGYQTFTPGALDIVGAGTNATSRRIKFWAEKEAIFNLTGSNSSVAINNTVDEAASLTLAAPFSTWRVGQNKPPDAPGAFDSFFVYQQSAGQTRLLITSDGKLGIGTNSPVHPLDLANGAYCTVGGVWTSVSDRNAKTDFKAIRPRDVLAKVAALPITEWRYKAETNGVRHVGPVAQDFHAAFGLGESERAIGAVDADGVALAAIQGLNEIVSEKDAEIQELQARNDALEKRLKALESAIAHLR